MSLFRILSIQNSKRRIIIKSHAYCVQLTVYCQRKKNLFISLIKLDFNNLMHIVLASWCLVSILLSFFLLKKKYEK